MEWSILLLDFFGILDLTHDLGTHDLTHYRHSISICYYQEEDVVNKKEGKGEMEMKRQVFENGVYCRLFCLDMQCRQNSTFRMQKNEMRKW